MKTKLTGNNKITEIYVLRGSNLISRVWTGSYCPEVLNAMDYLHVGFHDNGTPIVMERNLREEEKKEASVAAGVLEDYQKAIILKN